MPTSTQQCPDGAAEHDTDVQEDHDCHIEGNFSFSF